MPTWIDDGSLCKSSYLQSPNPILFCRVKTAPQFSIDPFFLFDAVALQIQRLLAVKKLPYLRLFDTNPLGIHSNPYNTKQSCYLLWRTCTFTKRRHSDEFSISLYYCIWPWRVKEVNRNVMLTEMWKWQLNTEVKPDWLVLKLSRCAGRELEKLGLIGRYRFKVRKPDFW